MAVTLDRKWSAARTGSIPLRGVVAAGLIAASHVLSVAPVRAETLHQALAAAYKYNPQIDAERARLRATDESVAIANSGFRPNIAGSADITHDWQRTRPPALTDGNNTSKGYSVSLSQPIFNGFRTINAVNEAEATVRAGREVLRSTEQGILLQAVTAFMDVIRDQAIVRLRENNVNVLSRELQATRDRFAVGEVTRTDVAQAEARRAASISALDVARSNLKISRATFERVIGHPPSRLVEPSGAYARIPKSQDEAITVATRESPEVVAALYREQAARFTVDRIWGELLPSVSLEAGYSQRFDPSKVVDEREGASVSGRVSIPIYEGGAVHARVRQAKHTHLAALQEIERARTVAREGVLAAWAQLTAARAQLESDQAAVVAARTALTGVREEQKVGQRTILDVLNAEQEYLAAQVQLETTRRNVVVTSYLVLQSVGRLNSEYLGLTKLVYDPEVHYNEVRRKWWGISITHSDGRREEHDLWDQHGAKRKAAK
ncbi:MAG: TolC family outer membrane protein [Hyphomicrobiaceae bacterium]